MTSWLRQQGDLRRSSRSSSNTAFPRRASSRIRSIMSRASTSRPTPPDTRSSARPRAPRHGNSTIRPVRRERPIPSKAMAAQASATSSRGCCMRSVSAPIRFFSPTASLRTLRFSTIAIKERVASSTVPDARWPCLSGGRQRQGQVDHRRLHDLGRLPVFADDRSSFRPAGLDYPKPARPSRAWSSQKANYC